MALVTLCVLACLATLANGDGGCPDGHANGESYLSGEYYYKCDNGMRAPDGCSNGGSRVPVQGTWDVENVRKQCVLGPDRYLAVLDKCCVLNGREYNVGETVDDGTTVFTCKKESSSVQPQATGCVHGGSRIAFDETVAKDKVVLKCRKSSSGRAEMTNAGCADNGRKYMYGEKYDSDKTAYTCTDSGPKPFGCVVEGRRWNDKDKRQDSSTNTVYECQVNGENTKFVAAACLGKDGGADQEKKPDCVWDQGDGSYLYRMKCIIDSASNVAVSRQISCIYKLPEGTFTVNPGCYYDYKSGGKSVGCVDNQGTLETKVFEYGKQDSGLRIC